MKIFETALINLRFLGTSWDESAQKFRYSYKMNSISLGFGVLCFFLTLLYLFFEANSFEEYTEALFICSSAVMSDTIGLFIYIKLDAWTEYKKICDIAAEDSEYWNKHIYRKKQNSKIFYR